MELVTPGIGLIFWMSVAFLLLLVLLRKFAWRPILKMLKERETAIDNALTAADKAREELKVLEEKNIAMAKSQKEQHLAMLQETEKLRAKILEEAKEDAKNQAEMLMQQARDRIEHEKKLAFLELKRDMANLSIEIASKVLKEQLKSDQKAMEFAEGLVDEMQLN
ncbi:MAG: F0F1 ATP synthase subunit B [Bacteroidales bacterium]|jgi:F-type H+-transporting ATPase subunit b|nr:F0F1 ATP synthase subunit B [Bacteroidales bacterium]